MKCTLCGLLMATVFALGCQKESNKGGPGATTGSTEDSQNIFTVKVPRTAVPIKQGQESKVTISIDRGKSFDQDVKLTLKLPKGVEATPHDAKLKKDQTQREFSLKAKKDADVGEHPVRVTGTPEQGQPASVSFVVRIAKADKVE